MPSPFPGMDPYLEHPALWPDVHNRLIAELGRRLGPQLRPKYYVALEERTYLDSDGLAFIGRPDLIVAGETPAAARRDRPAGESPGESGVLVQLPMPDEVRETYLEIRSAADSEVVTVLEILSPSNKRPGRGRQLYEDKRLTVTASLTHFVEIDLLRDGEPLPIYGVRGSSDYGILLSRREWRPNARLVRFSVRDAIPTFGLPLRRGDAEPAVDLRAALDEIYDTAGYDLRVDYGADPTPPVAENDAAWLDATLRASGAR